MKSQREHSSKERLRTLPRSIIFVIDLTIVVGALAFSRLLRHNFDAYLVFGNAVRIYLSAIIVNAVLFYIFKTYQGIVRHTTIQDSFRLMVVSFLASLCYIIIKYFFIQFGDIDQSKSVEYLTWASVFINFFIVSFALIGYRIIVRYLYKTYFTTHIHRKDKTKAAVYDTGEAGLSTKRAITDNVYSNMQVVYFLDDNPNKQNKTLEGIPILNLSKASFSKMKEEGIKNLLIAKENIQHSKLNEIVDMALEYDIQVQQVPPIEKWLQGKLDSLQIKNVNIEDLLERDVIKINNENVFSEVKNKCVLITGAAGSIGSEIVRQVLGLKPSAVVLCDSAESPLHELQLEVEEKFGGKNIKIFIGNICDTVRMEQLFEVYRPDIVFHAAAYKHVPMMEANPSIAVTNNVFGTKLLAELAVANHVKKFVMVSTDKAVNPTNVMGASKRIAEIFIQSFDAHQRSLLGNDAQRTRFITTRFGNVLGSNGSVIPRFRKQIEQGGPITVTHPDITRYFMTIPEACQLVIEAGAMGTGGEIFVFDMGQPVKITELARKMILLSGRIPETEIKIVYTGLRPGEKLYEELLNNSENTLPTYHEKIMIAKVREYNFVNTVRKIDQLIERAKGHYTYETVGLMKELVPEFISKNSVYEKLDTENKKDII